jgi:hypothetical protein
MDKLLAEVVVMLGGPAVVVDVKGILRVVKFCNADMLGVTILHVTATFGCLPKSGIMVEREGLGR